MKFIPSTLEQNIICEVNIEETFAITEEAYQKSLLRKKRVIVREFHGHLVHASNVRYHILNRFRKCECCGLIGTKMFLAKSLEYNSRLTYGFQLLGESRCKPNSEPHYIALTMDHIIEKRNNGSNDPENLRCLCYPCNQLREVSVMSTIKHMQNALPLATNIHRSTFALTKTKQNLEKFYSKLNKMIGMSVAIENNFDKIRDEQVKIQIKNKLNLVKSNIENLQKKISEIETNSQISGTIYSKEKADLLFNTIKEEQKLYGF